MMVRHPRGRGPLALVAVPALLLGSWLLAESAWILAKAGVARALIEMAWYQQLERGEPVPPWPWADTWPVARLRLGEDPPVAVLAGSSGQALAFGPGLVENSGPPGSSGRHTVIAAHRDTHFRDLRRLQAGALVRLQDGSGRWHRYRVRGSRVVDSRHEQLPILAGPGLLLVTCYPFNGPAALAAGGPLRYLVVADYLGASG